MIRANFVILSALSLAATSLVAQSQSSIKITVPFSFMASGKTLPAGEYDVQTQRPNLVSIRSKKDSKTGLMVLAHSALSPEMYGVPALRFNRYGDRYFLSQVWTGTDQGQELARSQAEREQIAVSPIQRSVVTLTAAR
jgi:hypothetical protein